MSAYAPVEQKPAPLGLMFGGIVGAVALVVLVNTPVADAVPAKTYCASMPGKGLVLTHNWGKTFTDSGSYRDDGANSFGKRTCSLGSGNSTEIISQRDLPANAVYVALKPSAY